MPPTYIDQPILNRQVKLEPLGLRGFERLSFINFITFRCSTAAREIRNLLLQAYGFTHQETLKASRHKWMETMSQSNQMISTLKWHQLLTVILNGSFTWQFDWLVTMISLISSGDCDQPGEVMDASTRSAGFWDQLIYRLTLTRVIFHHVLIVAIGRRQVHGGRPKRKQIQIQIGAVHSKKNKPKGHNNNNHTPTHTTRTGSEVRGQQRLRFRSDHLECSTQSRLMMVLDFTANWSKSSTKRFPTPPPP